MWFQRSHWLPWLGVLTLAAGIASAEVSPANQAAARELFDQAKALASQNKYEQACPKFEESQKLDPGTGTLFHLADCYEHTGRTASAWAMFLDVAGRSAGANRAEREAAARERASALRPKLAQLTVVVDAPQQPEGLSVSRDGTAVGKAVWGTAVPVDPGTHVIEASAPGRKTWSTKVEVPTGPNNIEVRVPALEEARGATPGRVAEAEPPRGAGRRTLGLVVGGVGLAAFGASIGVAAHAKSRFNDASSHCNGSLCDQVGVDQRHGAATEGNVATVIGGIGLAALAAGTILFVTAPSKSKAADRAPATALAVTPSGVLLQGVW